MTFHGWFLAVCLSMTVGHLKQPQRKRDDPFLHKVLESLPRPESAAAQCRVRKMIRDEEGHYIRKRESIH